MSDQPIGKYTTTLDMLMHVHPWLAELLQWNPIETAPKQGQRIMVSSQEGVVGEAAYHAEDDGHDG